MCIYVYIIHIMHQTAMNSQYTQFAIQDSRLFGPNQPLESLSAAVKLQKKGFWATQPLEQILDSEFLLCELGAPHYT